MGTVDCGGENCNLCVFFQVDYLVGCVGDVDLVVLDLCDGGWEERCGLPVVRFHEDFLLTCHVYR